METAPGRSFSLSTLALASDWSSVLLALGRSQIRALRIVALGAMLKGCAAQPFGGMSDPVPGFGGAPFTA
jgi:hypothetical protein